MDYKRIQSNNERFRVCYIYPLKSTQSEPHVKLNSIEALVGRPILPEVLIPDHFTQVPDATFESIWTINNKPVVTPLSFLGAKNIKELQCTSLTLYQVINEKGNYINKHFVPCTGFR